MVLESFYKENYPIVRGYLLSLCGDPNLADDLTAETFLRAIEKIDSYDPRYRPSTWLCTIGRNLYINERRRTQRRLPLEEQQLCQTPSPEALLIQKEQARMVIEAAQKLPMEQRRILFMRLQGMTFRSIGLALGKSENWARVTYFRAKSKILSEMEEKA